METQEDRTSSSLVLFISACALKSASLMCRWNFWPTVLARCGALTNLYPHVRMSKYCWALQEVLLFCEAAFPKICTAIRPYTSVFWMTGSLHLLDLGRRTPSSSLHVPTQS